MTDDREFETAAREFVQRARERPSYAGARRLGGGLELFFARDESEPIDDLLTGFPWPGRVRVRFVKRTYRELEEVQREAWTLLRGAGLRVISWIGEDTNDVRILPQGADPERVRAVVRDLGGAVVVVGRHTGK